jgi:beta-glucanase (GH16 family)
MLRKIALLMVAIVSLGLLSPLGVTAKVGLQSVSAQITSFSPASGSYYPGNAVTSSLRFKNTGTQRRTFWVGYSVQDKAGRWYDVSSHSVTLNPGQESTAQNKTWYVPTDPLLTTGYYKVVMAVWKTRPENGGATRLANAERADAFQVFNFRDNFASFDTNRWSKGAHDLGRSYLDPNNVSVSNGYLSIKIPANTLNGGEIESKSFYKYGTYRASVKLPYAPSSITGFFLYRSPDYYNEIDMGAFHLS